MSKSKITFNNTTVTGTNNSLIVGELRILTPSPGAIDIPQQAESVDSNIIIQKGDDSTFKSLMNSSPARPYGIKLYDQCGHLVNKWDATRLDNSSGNVRITSETKALFSNIELAKGLTGQTYLVISSYSGFERCTMKSSKKFLAEKDFEALADKTTMLNIVLFISEHIKKDLEELGIDLTKYFKSVYSSSSQTLLSYFVEFIAGKSVAGSRPSFQGMLSFGPGVEIAVARFRGVRDTSNIECQIRRGGRIQINSENKNSAVKFFIVLKHTNSADIKVSEEFTESEFPVVNYTAETLPGLKAENFTSLFGGFSFLEQLNAKKDITTMSDFVKSHPADVVSYCFDSPLTVFETIDSDSELSQMIIEYGSTLRQQIYQLLITHASKAYSNVNKKVRKTVMFEENELRPNYSDNSHLYSTSVNNYSGPGRLSSVPYNAPEYGDPVSCAILPFPEMNE
jgi:hypothetical protein